MNTGFWLLAPGSYIPSSASVLAQAENPGDLAKRVVIHRQKQIAKLSFGRKRV